MLGIKWLRPAFTLIELLVSVSVIGLLMSLLLPAIQGARESARRTQCVSQLKQLALAAHEYEGVSAHYPYGMGPRTFVHRTSRHGCYRSTTVMRLLPNVEHGAIYDAIDFSIDNCRDDYVRVNGPIFRTRIPELLCPSSEDGLILDDRGHNSHYVGNLGTEWNTASQEADGVFFDVSRIRPKDITDGLSHTTMFSERLLTETPSPEVNGHLNEEAVAFFSGWTDSRYFQPQDRFPTKESLVSACAQHLNSKSDLEYSPTVSNFWSCAGNNLFNHLLPPNHITCVNYGETYIYGDPTLRGSYPRGSFSPTSRHPGGVNVAMCDGSVDFVQDVVDLVTWRALGSRNGEELIGAR